LQKENTTKRKTTFFSFAGEGGSFKGARIVIFLESFFLPRGKEREIRERGGNPPSEKKSSDIKRNASRTTKSAARAAPTVFFVLCDDNDDDQESDH
jgi:hypothetical protein